MYTIKLLFLIHSKKGEIHNKKEYNRHVELNFRIWNKV